MQDGKRKTRKTEVAPLSASPAALLSSLQTIVANIVAAMPANLEPTLNFIVAEVANIMKSSSCTLRLFDEKTNELFLIASHGQCGDSQKPAVKVGEGLASLAFKENTPLVMTNPRDDPRYIYRQYALKEGVRSLLSVPLMAGNKTRGTLSVYFKRRRVFSEEETQFFQILASYLSLAIEVIELQTDLHVNYLGTIHGYIVALEAKDYYTRGHSERVAKYAVAIGKDLNLPSGQVQLLREASLLHDIGKLVVDTKILNKPGRLTEEEFAVVKKHPIIGERILKPLKLLEPFLSPIRHHHERVDGKGYPDGLTKDELSLIVSIVAVADAYDAMTSARPYRDALGRDETLRELEIGTDTQFDGRVVQALINTLERGSLEEA